MINYPNHFIHLGGSMYSIIKNSRLAQSMIFIIWIMTWYFITSYTFAWAEKPIFDSISLSTHQSVVWGPKQALKLQPESLIVARSLGQNFIINDSNGNFVCTGLPAEMQPSDTRQPFECQIRAVVKNTYKVDAYVTVYTTEAATFDLQQQTDLGKMLLACLTGAIFGTSIIMLFLWLLKAI